VVSGGANVGAYLTGHPGIDPESDDACFSAEALSASRNLVIGTFESELHQIGKSLSR
jgi:hypothetical protein